VRVLLVGVRGVWSGWFVAALLVAGVTQPAGATITGICPDGSVFIVQSAEAIPCREAKLVDPDEIPPARAGLLPRPYTWSVYEQANDPNNPYNLVDAARQVRELRRMESEPATAPGGAQAQPATGEGFAAAPLEAPRAEPPAGPLDVGLTHGELRDLYLIVELSQRQAPAALARETADGRERIALAFAHSQAFQAHLEGLFRRGRGLEGGSVLLFSVVARMPERFLPNLTFSQGHVAFTPRLDDRRQLGLLQGRVGDLQAGDVLLGYVVLPQQFDLHAPMDVYWNDRRIETTFRPF